MDDNYQTYLNRVARMTLPEAYRAQIHRIQESSKFQVHSGTRKAMPFPGYTVITPCSEDEEPENSAFYVNLHSYQQQLLQLSVSRDLIVPVPPTSFHLTLADLIWDSAYRDASEKNPEFEEHLRSCFSEIFHEFQQARTQKSPIRWQMLGLIVMSRAIGVCLVPQSEDGYQQIVNLRRAIYQNSQLMALGIEQHYDFTAHVTLGYFGEIPPDLDRDRFATKLSELNEQWLLDLPQFLVCRAELRKFDDMTRYYRQQDWPVLNFN